MQSTLKVSMDEQKKTVQPRKRIPFSFLLAGLAIIGAMMYLVYANTQASALYYLTVPELRHCSDCMTRSVRVAGIVEDRSVKQNVNAQSITFTITDNNQTLPVTYHGVVPDIFRAGVQVVVEGHYTGRGPFEAQTLLAKCPSKFQSATPAAK